MSETPDEEGIPEASPFDDLAQEEPEKDTREQPLPQPIRGGYFNRLSAKLREALHRSSR